LYFGLDLRVNVEEEVVGEACARRRVKFDFFKEDTLIRGIKHREVSCRSENSTSKELFSRSV